MIDYVTLMLLNMAAGLYILAYYFFRGVDDPEPRRWVPAFGVPGLVATVGGFHLIFTWPLIGPYNSLFGECSVLLGVLFLGAAVAMGLRVSLWPLAIYGLLAGLAAMVLGVQIVNLGLTKTPLIAGGGFFVTGLAGVLAAPIIYWRLKLLRLLLSLILLGAATLWAALAYVSYWMHMESANFSKYLPAGMKLAQ